MIDIGAAGTRITPVAEGYALRRGIVHTSRGGNKLDGLVHEQLKAGGYDVAPWFEVRDREIVTSPSFRTLHTMDVVRDVKRWMCFVPYKPVPLETRESYVQILTLPPYELPDGTMVHHTDAMSTAPEALWFNPSHSQATRKRSRSQLQPGLPPFLQPLEVNTEEQPLQDLVYAALAKCDVDARRDMLGNLLIVGGGALIDGVSNRLLHELAEIMPANMKVQITA